MDYHTVFLGFAKYSTEAQVQLKKSAEGLFWVNLKDLEFYFDSEHRLDSMDEIAGTVEETTTAMTIYFPFKFN